MLIIGSRALALLEGKECHSDLDLMCSFSEMQAFCEAAGLKPKQLKSYAWQVIEPKYGHIEFEITDVSESAKQYCQYVKDLNWHKVICVPIYKVKGTDHNLFACVAPYEVLYSIKRSHRHYPRQFNKHIRDYCYLNDKVDYDILSGITKIREKETNEREGTLKTPSLNKKTSEFFDDSVSNQVFVHDEIHQIMAYREKPMFEYIKSEVDSVKCDKQKWLKLPYEEKCQCVLEEAYVIALERAIIPMLFQGKQLATDESAIKWALMRICTTLTSGWFREFATDNYLTILDMYDTLYVEKFLKAVDDGRIKKI